MQLYACSALIALVQILTPAASAPSEGSAEGHKAREGLFSCDKLSDAEFIFIADDPKDSETVPCLKRCPTNDDYLWYHGFTTSDGLNYIDWGRNLTVSVPRPPRYADLGYFCCACTGEHPLDSCCLGVALKPQVISFTVTQEGQAVRGAYVGSKVFVSCEAFAYPSLALNILKDGRNVSRMKPDRESWYSSTKSLEMLSVTEEDSGTYICNAAITLRQNGETLSLSSQQLQELVVYRQLKVNMWQKGSADENLTIVCSVSSSISDYTVTWLFNNDPVSVDGTNTVESHVGLQHQLTLLAETRDNQGIYTCVVSTPYHGEEDRESLKFKVIDPRPDSKGGRPQPHGTKSHAGGSPAPVVIIVVVVAAVLAVVATVSVLVLVVCKGGWKWRRDNEFTRLSEDNQASDQRMKVPQASETQAELDARELQVLKQREGGSDDEQDGVHRAAPITNEVVLKGLRHRRQ